MRPLSGSTQARYPDPVLRVELENITNYENGGRVSLLPNKVGETKDTVMQMLPFWGKRDLKRALAAADAEQAQARAAARDAWLKSGA